MLHSTKPECLHIFLVLAKRFPKLLAAEHLTNACLLASWLELNQESWNQDGSTVRFTTCHRFFNMVSRHHSEFVELGGYMKDYISLGYLGELVKQLEQVGNDHERSRHY